MRFLLIHTAGEEGNVALAESSVVAAEVLPGRSSSERLVPAVRRLLKAQGWSLNELTAVVVVHGPGSFTGVRVGVSAAKGLCEASGVPLIAVSRLALLAQATGFAALDAGRGEFYFGEYSGSRMVREALLAGEDLRAAIGSHEVAACEAKAVEGLAGLRVCVVAEPLAGDILPFAVERALAGEFDDVAVLDANYLRRIDLEIIYKVKAEGLAR